MKFDTKAEMSEEDLKNFFDSMGEYKVEKIGESKFKIHYDGALTGPMNTIIYKPTIQTLLRQLHGMSYLEGYEWHEHKKSRK